MYLIYFSFIYFFLKKEQKNKKYKLQYIFYIYNYI